MSNTQAPVAGIAAFLEFAATPEAPGEWKRRPIVVLLQLPGASHIGAAPYPMQGPGDNDQRPLERMVNVLTCAPFFVVSRSLLRHCHLPQARLAGRMLGLVGAVAGCYHASSGPARLLLRKADYWLIALASTTLQRAVSCTLAQPAAAVVAGAGGQLAGKVLAAELVWPRVLQAVSLAATPFQPSAASTLNLAVVEGRCAWLAWHNPELHRPLALHLLLSVSAAASFQLDGLPCLVRACPYLHAAWHTLAAAGLLTTVPFLAHMERQVA
ncbi:hypothetical protein V8C86DRAFT_3189286 [Haematococcus lacustris]